MIETEKIINTYIDAYDNEIDEYEQIKRYTVWYEGYLFDGDTEGYNKHDYDKFEEAIALYNQYGEMIHIKDNLYLKIDNYNYTLMIDTGRVTKSGDKIYNQKYYDTLQGVIKASIRVLWEQQMNDKTVELDESLKILKQISDDVNNSVNNVCNTLNLNK